MPLLTTDAGVERECYDDNWEDVMLLHEISLLNGVSCSACTRFRALLIQRHLRPAPLAPQDTMRVISPRFLRQRLNLQLTQTSPPVSSFPCIVRRWGKAGALRDLKRAGTLKNLSASTGRTSGFDNQRWLCHFSDDM